MKIEILEEQIEDIEDTNLSEIIKLIIDAVRDFPLFEMNDTKLYFDEVKKLIDSDKITQNSIDNYLKMHQKEEMECDIWIKSSLNILLEALDLMNLYNIPFDKVQNKIESIT